MGELFSISFLTQTLAAWLLACARVMPLAVFSPMLAPRLIPWPVRLGAGGLIAMTMALRCDPGHLGTASELARALAAEAVVGGVLALGVSCVVSAVTGAMSLVDHHEQRPWEQHADSAGPIEKMFLAAFLATLGATGALGLLVAALLRTYDLITPVAAFDSVVPRTLGAHGATVIGMTSEFFSLTLMLALPVIAVRIILDMTVVVAGRSVHMLHTGSVGAIIRSLATLLCAATTLIAVLGVVFDRLARV